MLAKNTITEISNSEERNRIAKKSHKTIKRILEVRHAISCHYENIARLHAFKEGRISLKGKGYTSGVENYQRTAADEKRFSWSVNNLKQQLALLEHELAVLIEYGA